MCFISSYHDAILSRLAGVHVFVRLIDVIVRHHGDTDGWGIFPKEMKNLLVMSCEEGWRGSVTLVFRCFRGDYRGFGDIPR